MNGDTAIVTGATGGIGYALSEALAGYGLGVVLACRSVERGLRVRDRIVARTGNERVMVSELDLASFGSIGRFVREAEASGLRLRWLFNNAGVMCKDFCRTADGFETSIGVNYLGPVLLTRLLLPLLCEGACVVNTVSVTRKIGRIDPALFGRDEAGFSRFGAYGDSKLALSLFSWSLAERLRDSGVRVLTADPGVVDTEMIRMQRWFDPLADLFFRPFIKSPRQGAEAALRAAFSTPSAASFFRGRRALPMPLSVRNHPLAGWLWDETERLLREKGVVLPDLPAEP